MAALKFFSFLCVAALATGALVPFAKQPINDIILDVTMLLLQLSYALTDAIGSAVTAINSLPNTVDTAISNIVSELNGTLDSTIQTRIDQIVKLNATATAGGVNATECIGNSIPDLQALPDPYLKHTLDCLGDQLQRATAQVNQTLNHVQGLGQVVIAYSQEIANCAKLSIIQQTICVSKVTAEITGSIVSLPAEITNDVLYLTKSISSIISDDLPTCVTNVVKNVTVAGDAIVAKVTKCVNNL